jgi:hypothetical protein
MENACAATCTHKPSKASFSVFKRGNTREKLGLDDQARAERALRELPLAGGGKR